MASDAKKRGGNVIANFRYAQKATVFSFSSTQWNASGTIMGVPQEVDSTDAAADATSDTATKRCPMCAEEIRSEARKCKHCGEIFS